MDQIIQSLFGGVALRVVLPVLSRFMTFRYLHLEVQPAWTMIQGDRLYRAVTVRVFNRGNVAIDKARAHLQSVKTPPLGESMHRDEYLSWHHNETYEIGQSAEAETIRIEPGSGEHLISLAYARSDDHTNSGQLCIARRDRPDDAPALMLIYSEVSPMELRLRVVADGYASRALRVRVWMVGDDDQSWGTLQAERVSRLRDARRALWRNLRSIGRTIERRLRVSQR